MFVQKFKFIVMKMHKKTVATFWLRYMHQIVYRLGLCPRPIGGAYVAPPDPLAGLGVGPTRNGKEGGEGKGGEGKGVPECPNPELASLGREQKSDKYG